MVEQKRFQDRIIDKHVQYASGPSCIYTHILATSQFSTIEAHARD